MKKVLIVPEAVDSHGVKLAKGKYTPEQLEKKKFSSQNIAWMVSKTAAHWEIEGDAEAPKADTAK